MIKHRSVINFIVWFQNQYNVKNDSRATISASFSFDAFGLELWPYLLKGSTVYLMNDTTRYSLREIVGLCLRSRITHCFLSSALISQFIGISENLKLELKYLLTGGDKLSLMDGTLFPYRIADNYGPTETTIVSTSHVLTDKYKHSNVIGRPINNTQIYILDRRMKLVPKGVAGEIFIGGAGVSSGYLNQPALTAQQFIDSPFAAGEAIYKTGDIGRWRPDGNIEFMGRIDDQIKIRGHRVELKEIELQLLNYKGIESAVVTTIENATNGQMELIAYYTGPNDLEIPDINIFMGRYLASYMLPQHILRLEKIPLTVNGKLDRDRLPLPEDIIRGNDNPYVAPKAKIEEKLVDAWREVLNIQRIGVKDNFFELGGNSILAISLLLKLQKEYSITITDIFDHQTIEELAEKIAQTDLASPQVNGDLI